MILEDPLDRLQQVGAQRQRALEGGLPVPEELGQSFTPHAVCERGHRAGGQQGGGGGAEGGLLAHQAHGPYGQ